MLNALSSAVSGLDSFQQDMDVIGNNIANINTDGFKAGMVNFADTFSDTLVAGTGTVQIGTGVYDQAITNNWSQGAVNATGVNTDLAISGNGFFVVQDPTSNTQYVTQNGSFQINASGYLVTAGGQISRADLIEITEADVRGSRVFSMGTEPAEPAPPEPVQPGPGPAA
jgi:flagellar hook protein FlgE